MPRTDWNRGGKQDMRQRLAREQNWRCCHCGGDMKSVQGRPDSVTLEHVVPLDQGGVEDDWYNLAAAHQDCNKARGNELALTGDWMRA